MYLIDFIGKIISFILISISSLFGMNVYSEKTKEITNANQELDLNIINYVEEHDTKYIYNPKMPYNEENIIVPGVDKITYKVIGSDEIKILQDSVTEVIEKGTGYYGLFTGRMTGYSAECYGCSKEGYVACLTKDRQKFSIIHDGLYYEDEEFGSVRVIAAAVQKFPCGTIVEITKQGYEPYYTVVMDRGSAMNTAWDMDLVLIDLAFDNDKDALASDLTGRNLTFRVKRWGW